MSVIKVSKKIEDLDELTFLKETVKELQKELKKQGKSFQFDIEERGQKTRQKKGK